MTLEKLINEFRVRVLDKVDQYLFANHDVADWLIEAEREACVRARLLHESHNDRVCQIRLVEGQSVYKLHWALYEIDHIEVTQEGENGLREPIKLVSREYLDDHVRQWRHEDGVPRFAVQNDTTIRFCPTPDKNDLDVRIEGYRLPMRGLTRDLDSRPEIHEAHHRHLIEWALYRAFRVPDADSLNLGESDQAMYAFERYFGLSPDADLRRITRHDTPHVVTPAWP